MIRARLMMLFALASSALPAAPPVRAPNFECADASGVTYRAWIRPQGNLLQVITGGKTREIKLSSANASREAVVPGSPVVYNRFNFAGKHVSEMIDLSTELAVQYLVEDGRTRVRVGVVVDDRERTSMTCRTGSYAVETTSLFDETPAATRLAEWIAQVSVVRSQKGPLKPMAEAAVAAAIRRFLHSPHFKRDAEGFLGAIAMPVKNLDPRTVEKVESKLPPPAAEWWRGALAKLRYRYYPDVLRYSSWVREGTRPKPDRDMLSVIAGFKEFGSSPIFSSAEMKAYFLEEIASSLKTIVDDEALAVAAGLNDPARAFFLERWQRAIGRRTVSDFPELVEMAQEMKKLVEAKTFDPMPIQRKLSSFTQTPLARQPDGPGLFIQAVTPAFKRLTPRQREDVMGWLEGPERELFLRMTPQ